MKRIYEAIILAQELAHPFSLVLAFSFAACLHLARREHQAAQEEAEALLATSTEYGFPIWMAWGTIWRGRALAGQGQQEEGFIAGSPRGLIRRT